MADSNVDSLLRSIASSSITEQIGDSYADTHDAMKHTGRPTNNILLSSIHGELNRMGDDVLRVSARLSKLEETNRGILCELTRLCSLTETQNEILSSNALSTPNEQSGNNTKGKQNASGTWYYQGTKLTSKYHVYACIIFHLIDMVQMHMDVAGKHYPDSVDCDFKVMHNAVRVVSTERCRIASVEYKNTISLKEKDSQPFEVLYPLISSSDSKSPTTLSESMVSRLSNQITRGVMQDVEWIRQRLCHLDGVLSIKQIDILKSICHPIVKGDSDSELNWNEKVVKPRCCHPLSKDIAKLPKIQKDEYMRLRVHGYNIHAAYEEASGYSPQKK